MSADAPLVLLRPEVNDPLIDMAMIPEAWDFRLSYESGRPVEPHRYRLTATPQNDGVIVMKRYVGDELKGAPQLPGKDMMVVKASGVENMDGAEIALVGKNGATYSAPTSRCSSKASGSKTTPPSDNFQPSGYLIIKNYGLQYLLG